MIKPGKVNVASRIVKIPTNIIKLAIRAVLAIKPNILYLKNINSITKTKPIINDIAPDLIESSPKSGPTVLSSTTKRGVGKAPDLRSSARSVAS